MSLFKGVASFAGVTTETEYTNIKYSRYTTLYIPLMFATTPDRDGDTEKGKRHKMNMT